MIVFHIPSWYPNDFYRIQGIFIKDYINAAAKFGDDIHIVSNQRALSIPLSKDSPIASIKNVINYFGVPKEKIIRHSNNLVEFCKRNIDADERFYPGKIKNLLQLHAISFEQAQKEIGKIDIIHAHVSYPGGYIASILSERFGVPFLVSEQMSPFPLRGYDSNERISHQIKTAFRKAAIATCLSTPHQHTIEQVTSVKPRIVSNLVDETLFTPFTSDKKIGNIFFTLCLMSDQKGIEDLLQAIKLVTDRKQDVKFRIGGDGPKLKAYQSLAQRLGIAEYIEWLGFVNKEQAVQEFNNAKCFVLPSKHESMGVVFAEALACGIPVIATRCGGPEDFVDDSCGILIEVGDIQKIAEGIMSIACNEITFNASNLRSHFLSRFSTKVIVQKYASIYKEILASNN